MTPRCDKVADIGTDHAYVPVALVSFGICERAVAADIGKGPLERARTCIEGALLADRIETRLSDGLKAIEKDEVQCAVITGMGGRTIIGILEETDAASIGIENIVISPQSEAEKVREYLYGRGYVLTDEALVREDEKYYPVMVLRVPGGDDETKYDKAYSGYDGKLSRDILFRYGPLIIKEGAEELTSFLAREKEMYGNILEKLSGGQEKRREEIQTLLDDIVALQSYLSERER